MDTLLKNILVTGGTGFIGQKVCERLVQEGYTIYILTRNKKLNRDKNSTKKNYIHALSEIQDIHIDIIINFAGENIAQRWTKSRKQRIYDSRIVTTRNLISFLRAKKEKPTLLISASAVGYYGTDLKKAFTEENETSTINSAFASHLCKDWENEASHAIPLGIRTVFLRIGPVLAKDGGMLAKLLPSFYLGLGSKIGDGNQWLSWIDRDDLINLIMFIIHNPEINGVINATSPNPVTNTAFSFALAKVLNRPCLLKVPAFIFKLIFGQMADEIMIQGQKVFPKKAVSHGFEFSYPTIEQSFSKIFKS